MAEKNMNAKISVEFEETANRQQLSSGDNLPTLFGKIKKIISDLSTSAFSGSYNDLSDKPTTATTDTDGLMSAEDKTKLDSVDDTYALKSKYGDTTINVGRKADTTVGEYSTAEGYNTTASGKGSHAEGYNTTASSENASPSVGSSHAEGYGTTSSGCGSHAEGMASTAVHDCCHAEGFRTRAILNNSHSEGYLTTALGQHSHSEGESNFSIFDSIPDFSNSTSINDIMTAWETKKFTLSQREASHTEGRDTLAFGYASHAEGKQTRASGDYSHAEGYGTIAGRIASHASGQFNKPGSGTLFSIGDGTADDARHNAFEITTTGGKLHDKDIATTDLIPSSLPANGGNADTVNNHTVNIDVPSNAKFTDTTYSNMTGATSSAAGIAGLVPAPAKGNANRYLRSDGTWVVPPDNNTWTVMKGATSSAAGAAGIVPAPTKGKQTSFLRGDGTWSVPGLGEYLPLSGGTTTGSTALANNFRVIAGDYTRIQFLFNDTWSTVIQGDNTNSGLILGSSSAKKVALTVDDPAHAYVNNYPIYSGGYKPYLTGYFSMGTTNKTITCNFKPSFVVIFNATAGGSAHFVYFSDGTNTAITITNTGFRLNADYVASSITYGYIAFR